MNRVVDKKISKGNYQFFLMMQKPQKKLTKTFSLQLGTENLMKKMKIGGNNMEIKKLHLQFQ